jgi:hypothetical protein
MERGSEEADIPKMDVRISYVKVGAARQAVKNAAAARNIDLININQLIRWKDEIGILANGNLKAFLVSIFKGKTDKKNAMVRIRSDQVFNVFQLNRLSFQG